MSGAKRLTRRTFAFLCASPLTAGLLQEPFKITDNVDLVLLDVSVKDSNGHYVTDLGKNAFRVDVDGKPRDIIQFERVDAPVTIGLIVDNSGSMRNKRQEVVLSGLAFAKASNPQDEFFVVNFNNTVHAGLPAGVPFTDKLQTLRSALYMGELVGQTALYDAIAYGLKHLETGHHEKRTLIVVSDGGDNISQLSQRDIVRLITLSRATVYTIGLVDPDDQDLKPEVLKKFANTSGGDYYQPKELNEVMDVLEKISKDIRSRYSIGFSPAPDSGSKSKHSIRVTATRQGQKQMVRSRTSYTTDLAGNTQETSLRDWQ